MMYFKSLFLVSIICICACTTSKEIPSTANNFKRIKVILLGVWHFNPNATGDANKINADIMSPKNQKDLKAVINRLATYKPEKIFMEFNYGKEAQSFLDSLYWDFKDNETFDWAHEPYSKKDLDGFKRTEHIQLTFKLAKTLNHSTIYGADHYAAVSQKVIKEWKKSGGGMMNKDFFNVETPTQIPDFDSLLQVKSVGSILRYLNSTTMKKLLMEEYFHYNLGFGNDTTYVGVTYAQQWQNRNMKIYTNILRNLDYKKDNTILVIYGGSHTAILKDYFNNNDVFEVLDTEKVLKDL